MCGILWVARRGPDRGKALLLEAFLMRMNRPPMRPPLELAAARALDRMPEDPDRCWADDDELVEMGAVNTACGAPTDDPLGLCAKHRVLLLGAPAEDRKTA